MASDRHSKFPKENIDLYYKSAQFFEIRKYQNKIMIYI